MLSVSTQLRETIERSVELGVQPLLYAEWEMSGYYDYTVSGANSVDAEIFPLGEVFLPHRPMFPGAPKALVNAAKVTGPLSTTKYRIPSEDSVYKYFRSKNKSGVGGTISGINPTIVYAQNVRMNKVVVQFETANAVPTSVTISTSTNGTSFTSVGSFTPDVNGRIEIYFNGTAWTTTRDLGNYVQRRGVRVTVNTMSSVAQAADIIAISPRLEVELTDLVKTVSTNLDRETVELDSPVGVMQANVANFDLDNSDGRFNPHNVSSEYYGIIDENVRFRPYMRVRRSDGLFEDVQQGVFFSDDWTVNDDATVSVSCTDQSKFLQEAPMPDCFYENKTAEYIIDDIMERNGYGQVVIRAAAADAGRRIPFVWFTAEQSVWEALTEIAKAEQAAFYFNEAGRFVYETRDWLFNQTTPVQTMRAVNAGLDLANIESMSTEFTVAANDVTVEYTRYAPNSMEKTGKDNVLWSVSDDSILRIRPISTNITSSSTWFAVGAGEGQFWPLEGIVHVEGEYIRYSRVGSSNPDRFNIVKRGEFGSPIFDHLWQPRTGWGFESRDGTGRYTGTPTIKGNVSYPRELSTARIRARANVGSRCWNNLYLGSQDTSFQIYGTSMEIPANGTGANGEPTTTRGHCWGGIRVTGTSWARGVYFEIRRRGSTGNNPGFIAYAVLSGTNMVVLDRREFTWDINQRVDMVVTYERASNTYNCYLNGSRISSFQYYNATLGKDGWWGPFVRGNSTVDFHHFYTVNNWAVAGYPIDDLESWVDRTTGGFAGDYALREWAGSVRRRNNAEWFFDDYGALAREAREYDVRHDVYPTRTSDVFISNDSNISIIHHKKSNFASKLAIVNSSFRSAMIQGEQQIDAERSLNHEMFIHGDPIIETAEEEVNVKDEVSIRRRGSKELIIESPWIQTKTRANRIANFITQRWGQPVDIINLETIIIPYLEPGDLVSVDYPRFNMSPATHRYHVLGVDRTYGADHSQTLRLRRAY